jgi:hypothetical protein
VDYKPTTSEVEASEPVGTAFFYAGPWPQAQLPLYFRED